MATLDVKRPFEGKRLMKAAAAVSAAGWIGWSTGLGVAPRSAAFAYLTAFAFATSIALGALVFLMATYVVRAKWNTSLRRLNEAIVSVLPVLALLFVPVALSVDRLYIWAEPPHGLDVHVEHALAHRRGYFDQTFFVLRTLGYFAVWSACGVLLSRWSLARDRETPHASYGSDVNLRHARERSLSSALLPFVALALTFASFDWLMSLDPLWMSSIFGVYYFAGGFGAAFGVLSVLGYAAQRAGAEAWIRPAHFHALGRLMFGFTIFWAYCAYFQALLVSLPNRPEEVLFYQRRLEGGWEAVAWVLGTVRFVLPFLLLLPRSIKFNSAAMAALGTVIIAGHYVDMYWLVAPVHGEHGPMINIWDMCALAAVGGTCVAFGAFWLRGRPLVPVGDPVLSESIAYRSPV